MAITLISNGTSASTVASITLNNIPQQYKTLIFDLRIYAASSANHQLTFNNDQNGSYAWVNTGTWTAARNSQSTTIPLVAGAYGDWRHLITIPGYSQVTKHGVSWLSSGRMNNARMQIGAGDYQQSWSTDSAITRIDFAHSATFTYSYELWGLS